ncbi:MAG: ParB/RepB/Spo0J family partition protein [Candidatus Omnitrophica bacterium]|nr:ParB/RepB/Spo0J family partition protein [Candidatus Omnitrophota bacterium]
MEKRALGKGLSALIPVKDPNMSASQSGVLEIPISQIRTNKYQPRTDFKQDKLNDLINSIREKGVVQPVLARKVRDGYELIAGERRLRAAKTLGLEKIPAILKNATDVDMLEISLIENIQRQELNSIEEAVAYQRLVTEFGFTQDAVAKVLGKDRSTVANVLRLLNLPKKIQGYISNGDISAGHAKAILALPTEGAQMSACVVIMKKGLSVRESEALVARRLLGSKPASTHKKEIGISEIENQLQQVFGTRVVIVHGKKRGRIQIEYYSNEDLNRILDLLNSSRQAKQ